MNDLPPPAPSVLTTLQRAVTGLYRPGWLALLMLVQAILLAGYAQDSWRISPDSALYLSLGRSIVEGQGYVFNYQPHAMVPPLWPCLLAGAMSVLGTSFLAINILQIFLAMICTPLAFWLMRRMVGADLAMLCTVLFALNYDAWEVASFPLSDPLFTILAITSMALLTYVPDLPESNRNQSNEGGTTWLALGAAGVAIVAATFTRVNGIVLVPAAMATIYLGWPRRGRAFRIITACIMAALCMAPIMIWQAAVRSHVSGPDATYLEASYLNKPLGEMLRGMAEQMFLLLPHELSNMIIGSNSSPAGLNLLIPALAAIGSVILFRRGQWALPTAMWFMFALLAVSRGVVSRYLMFLLPGLGLLTILGILFLLQRVRQSRELNPAAIRKVLLPVLACLILAHVIHSAIGEYGCIRHSVPHGSRTVKDQGWLLAGEYILAQAPLQAGGRPSAVILTPQSSVIHYWTRARTLPLRSLRDSLEPQLEQIAINHPNYLVVTKSEKRMDALFAAMRARNFQATKLDDVKLPGDVVIWRLTYPVPAASGPALGTRE